MKRLLPILVTALFAFGPAAAPALAAGGDNTAVAINTRDGASVFKLAFSIKHVMSDVVDSTNAAVAVSSCTDCQSVAIAIEIVLIQSDASTITPTNLAFAYNLECTLCVSVAEAYQFVLTTGGNVHFTAQGNQQLAEIRRQLEQLRTADLSIDELQAKLDEIAKQIATVLTTELVAAGNSGNTQQQQEPAQPATTEPTATATTPATTTEPPPTTTNTTPTTTTTDTTTSP